MPRTRSVKPSFFKNEHLAECEPMARLLFVGLWTLADREGRLEYRPLRIKAELFPYESCEIVPLFRQLADRGFIVVYKVGERHFLQIPTFAEHQRCHPSEHAEGFPSCEDGQAVIFHGEQLFLTANCAFPSFPSFPSLSSSPSFNPSTVGAPSKPQRRPSSKPADPIRWSSESGWEGITDADHAEWSRAYPAADLPVELAKAHQWLKANPKKATKSNWRRWLTTVWLSKCQDRGGTHREAANRPQSGPAPVDLEKRRYWRGDAERSMTAAEYAAWRRDRANGGIAQQLASKITLREDT